MRNACAGSRQFFAHLPAWPAVPVDFEGTTNPKPFGVTVRRMGDDAQTFLEIANDSPYPIRLAGTARNSRLDTD